MDYTVGITALEMWKYKYIYGCFVHSICPEYKRIVSECHFDFVGLKKKLL